VERTQEQAAALGEARPAVTAILQASGKTMAGLERRGVAAAELKESAAGVEDAARELELMVVGQGDESAAI
jgi:hypothetical protein